MTRVKSSSVPTPRRRRHGDHLALPYAEPSTPEEAYQDASELAGSYPVRRLPHQDVADKLLSDTRWQQICEEISSHGALDRRYLD